MFDPEVFDEKAVAPETAALNAEIKAAMGSMPRAWERSPQETRDAQRRGDGVFPPIKTSERAYWRSIEGRHGQEINVRILPPASGEMRGIYYRIHGGGWVFGAADFSEPFMEELADATGLLIVSVDYRLAPEYPFPAAPEDCEDAACWLVQNAQAEFGTGKIYIGGESAGAHLTALTLLRMRDNYSYTDFQAVNFIYGCFDLSFTPSAVNWGEENLILDTPTMQWFFDQFVPGRDRRSPEISPLYANLEGLPPALFSIGTLDPLLDDSLFIAQRWSAAGNKAELALYPGGIHGFDHFRLSLSDKANKRYHSFLNSY